MPHSPRVYGDRLWLLNSGTGHFGCIDQSSGQFEAVAFCPGYTRGLTFHEDCAIVGLSGLRKDRTFRGLPLDENLRSAGAEPRCGINVIDLNTGDTVHWLRIEGVVSELYDVVTMPNVIRPHAIGFQSDEICRLLTIGESQKL